MKLVMPIYLLLLCENVTNLSHVLILIMGIHLALFRQGWLSYDQWLHITIEMSWSYINLALVINCPVIGYLIYLIKIQHLYYI